MKFIGLTLKASCITFFLAFSPLTLSYEVRTHEALTKEALQNSIYGTDTITSLGLKAEEQLPNPILMNCIGSVRDPQNDDCDFLGQRDTGSYVGLILNGSSYEDLEYAPFYLRSLSHFYDPVNDRGLTPESGYQIAVLIYKWGIYELLPSFLKNLINPNGTAFGYKNPDWALGNLFPANQTVVISVPQFYSYSDAYKYLYDALTNNTKDERNANFGKTFEALGQVMHLLQDMAAIEHVRNDAHLPLPLEKSRYETYTNELVKDGRLSFTGYFPINTPVNFPKARDYWVTGTGAVAKFGRGLSEFTNTNFFSQDTNIAWGGWHGWDVLRKKSRMGV